jgi:hypothetical protein
MKKLVEVAVVLSFFGWLGSIFGGPVANEGGVHTQGARLTGFEVGAGEGGVHSQGVRLTGFEVGTGEGGTHTQGPALTGFEP